MHIIAYLCENTETFTRGPNLPNAEGLTISLTADHILGNG